MPCQGLDSPLFQRDRSANRLLSGFTQPDQWMGSNSSGQLNFALRHQRCNSQEESMADPNRRASIHTAPSATTTDVTGRWGIALAGVVMQIALGAVYAW